MDPRQGGRPLLASRTGRRGSGSQRNRVHLRSFRAHRGRRVAGRAGDRDLAKGQTLRVRDPVSLAPSGDEIDIEAIAAVGDSNYIIGSHVISRNKGKSRQSLQPIRLGVDRSTGRPTRPLSCETASPIFCVRTPFSGYFAKPLHTGGEHRGAGLAERPVVRGAARPQSGRQRLRPGGRGQRCVRRQVSAFVHAPQAANGSRPGRPGDRRSAVGVPPHRGQLRVGAFGEIHSVRRYDQDRNSSWSRDGAGSEVHKIGPFPT